MRKRDAEAGAVRRQFESAVGCKVEGVQEFEVVATADSCDRVTVDLLAEDEASVSVSGR